MEPRGQRQISSDGFEADKGEQWVWRGGEEGVLLRKCGASSTPPCKLTEGGPGGQVTWASFAAPPSPSWRTSQGVILSSPLPQFPVGSTVRSPSRRWTHRSRVSAGSLSSCSLPGTVSLHASLSGFRGSSLPESLLAWRGEGSHGWYPKCRAPSAGFSLPPPTPL